MVSTLRLTFVEDGVSAIARLERKRAPETVARVLAHLPLTGSTIHGMYSGPELFVRADAIGPCPPENQIHRALPGDVCYWWHEGNVRHLAPEPMGEILFIYGRGAAIMGPEGQPTWANLFARIVGEAEAFYAVARRVRTEGPRMLRLEAVMEE